MAARVLALVAAEKARATARLGLRLAPHRRFPCPRALLPTTSSSPVPLPASPLRPCLPPLLPITPMRPRMQLPRLPASRTGSLALGALHLRSPVPFSTSAKESNAGGAQKAGVGHIGAHNDDGDHIRRTDAAAGGGDAGAFPDEKDPYADGPVTADLSPTNIDAAHVGDSQGLDDVDLPRTDAAADAAAMEEDAAAMEQDAVAGGAAGAFPDENDPKGFDNVDLPRTDAAAGGEGDVERPNTVTDERPPEHADAAAGGGANRLKSDAEIVKIIKDLLEDHSQCQAVSSSVARRMQTVVILAGVLCELGIVVLVAVLVAVPLCFEYMKAKVHESLREDATRQSMWHAMDTFFAYFGHKLAAPVIVAGRGLSVAGKRIRRVAVWLRLVKEHEEMVAVTVSTEEEEAGEERYGESFIWWLD